MRRYDVAGNSVLTIGLGMVVPTILAHGTPAAKERYLPALQRGDLIGCQLFSEPGAGSDLASVATRAVRDGDGWRVSGQKAGTSGAQFADVGELLCRTSDGPRYRNLSAFLADAGEWGTYAWSQFVLGTPGYRLGGGTDEILKTTIGERVLGLPKEPKATNE